jgi:hypothetical protein
MKVAMESIYRVITPCTAKLFSCIGIADIQLLGLEEPVQLNPLQLKI